ncbi:MAG: YbaN family protein [Bacteroidales bacterium]|nr:YbaN family protein [Bacteroidales bacterium]
MHPSPYKSSPWRPVLIVLGCLSTILGLLGIFIPGLPTTPFILLSSWLFYQSSEQLHRKLNDSFLGQYIRDYEKNKGLSVRTKIWAILLMCIMVTLSITYFLSSPIGKWIVGIAGGIGMIVVAFVVPTRSKIR